MGRKAIWRIRLAFAFVALGALTVGSQPAVAGTSSTRSGDQAIAEDASYQLDDFPSGWKAKSHASSSTTDKLTQSLKICKAFAKANQKAKKASTGALQSKDFEQDDETHSSTIRVYRDEATAQAIFDVYVQQKSQECLAQAAEGAAKVIIAQEQAQRDVEGSVRVSTDVAEVSGAQLGDDTARYQIQLKASGDALIFDQEAYYDLVYVLDGRAIAVYQRTRPYEPSSEPGLLEQLTATSVARLRAGLDGLPIPDPAAPVAFGTEQVAGDGSTVTVYGFQAGVPYRYAPDQFGNAPAGSVWAVADAQVCAPNGTTGEVDVSPSNFTLVFSDNTRAEPTFSGPGEPTLDYGTVRSGDCVRGALNFTVPANRTPTQIIYDRQYGEGRPVRWAVA